MAIISESTDVDAHYDHTIEVTQVEAHHYAVEVYSRDDGYHLTYTDTLDRVEHDWTVRSIADHGEVWCRTCDVLLDASADFAA